MKNKRQTVDGGSDCAGVLVVTDERDLTEEERGEGKREREREEEEEEEEEEMKDIS